MKKILSMFSVLAIALMSVSCGDDYISPDQLFKDASKQARTKVSPKDDDSRESTTTDFKKAAVYEESDMDGSSWFVASSGGKMVYDFFMLSIYFQDIRQMKVGDTLKPSRAMFTFPFSSNSDDTTFDYDGEISLADKGSDYVILCFHKVKFSCHMGNYLTDGYLYCTLENRYQSQK